MSSSPSALATAAQKVFKAQKSLPTPADPSKTPMQAMGATDKMTPPAELAPKMKPAPLPAPPKDMSKSAAPSSFKRGGKVRKTGFAKVHKGERVLTRKQQHGSKKGFH